MATVISTGRTEDVETRRNLDPTPIVSAAAAGIQFRSGYTSNAGAVTGGRAVSLIQAMPGNSFYLSFPGAITDPVAGDLYSMSVRVRNDGTIPLSIRAAFYASGANTYLSGSSTTIAPGVTETLVVDGAVVPPGATSLTPRLINGTSNAQPTDALFAVLDGVTVEKAPASGEPFSGATPNNPPYSYAWTGFTNQSASVERLTRPIEVVPEVVYGFEASREARTIVHTILGRSDPDVTFRPAGLRAGTLSLVFANSAAAAAAETILRAQQVFTIAADEVPEVGMAFVVADGEIVTRINETRKSWTVEVPFREVAT